MSQKLITIAVFIWSSALALNLPKHDGDANPNRIIDKPLSDQEHFVDGDQHNTLYDHEAFLGEDEAKQFDELSPEESRTRLGIIFDKIDKDKDGYIDGDELKKWIRYTQKRYIVTDGKTQWKIHNPGDKDNIPWDEYKKSNYGFLDDEPEGSDDRKTYTKMLERDQRRWKIADQNNDNALDQEEFQNFIHPEDVPHMNDIVITETIEDIDKDGDMKISLQEYISDLYRGEPGDDEPSWVQSERDTFNSFRDKNGDGMLDHDEVKQWIMPDDFDHADAESNHLIHSSDADKDGKLTKEEVLEKYDVFVGSQATDFGEALVKHDEF